MAVQFGKKTISRKSNQKDSQWSVFPLWVHIILVLFNFGTEKSKTTTLEKNTSEHYGLGGFLGLSSKCFPEPLRVYVFAVLGNPAESPQHDRKSPQHMETQQEKVPNTTGKVPNNWPESAPLGP